MQKGHTERKKHTEQTLKIINIVIIHSKCNANLCGLLRYNSIHFSGCGKCECVFVREKINDENLCDADLFTCNSSSKTAPVHSFSLLFNFPSLILLFFCVQLCLKALRRYRFYFLLPNFGDVANWNSSSMRAPPFTVEHIVLLSIWNMKRFESQSKKKYWILYEYNMWIVSFGWTYTHKGRIRWICIERGKVNA